VGGWLRGSGKMGKGGGGATTSQGGGTFYRLGRGQGRDEGGAGLYPREQEEPRGRKKSLRT